MRAQDAVKPFINSAAGTSTAFALKGGKYAVIYSGTGTGTVDLEVMSLDGATYVKVITQITATTGYATVDLPAGTYQAVIDTFTANYLSITRIPGE